MQWAKVPVAEAKLWGAETGRHRTGFQSSSDPESCRLLGRSLTIPASIAGSRKQNIIGDPLGPSQLSNNMTTSITIMGKEE